MESCWLKLDELLAEFTDLDPQESLELLVEMSDQLPDLSPKRNAERTDSRFLVKECQTPVYLWVDLVEGVTRLESYVTEKSPTVRGYVAMLVEGLCGVPPDEIAALPENLLPQMGLDQTLGMTRRRGFTGLLRRIKQETAHLASGTETQSGA